jgi:hypothetical protein
MRTQRSAQGRQEVQADKHSSEEPLCGEGAGVLLSTEIIQVKHPEARKLLPLWFGPLKVLQEFGWVAHRLQFHNR